jgi:hypothetical protein
MAPAGTATNARRAAERRGNRSARFGLVIRTQPQRSRDPLVRD